MVLLQQTISWALAFQGVVWDVPRVAENQMIHYVLFLCWPFVKVGVANDENLVKFRLIR